MRRRGIISLADTYEIQRKLILANYHFVRVDVQGLLSILRHYKYKPSPDLGRILGMMSGPDCEEMSAVMVGAEFIYWMWLQVPVYEDKLAILGQMLDALVAGRVAQRVIPILKAALQNHFNPYSKPLPAIFEYITQYQAKKDAS